MRKDHPTRHRIGPQKALRPQSRGYFRRTWPTRGHLCRGERFGDVKDAVRFCRATYSCRVTADDQGIATVPLTVTQHPPRNGRASCSPSALRRVSLRQGRPHPSPARACALAPQRAPGNPSASGARALGAAGSVVRLGAGSRPSGAAWVACCRCRDGGGGADGGSGV